MNQEQTLNTAIKYFPLLPSCSPHLQKQPTASAQHRHTPALFMGHSKIQKTTFLCGFPKDKQGFKKPNNNYCETHRKCFR